MRRDLHEANRISWNTEGSGIWMLRGAVWLSMLAPALINFIFPDFLNSKYDFFSSIVILSVLIFTPFRLPVPEYHLWGVILGCWAAASTLALLLYQRRPSRSLWFMLAFNLIAAMLVTWVSEFCLLNSLMTWFDALPWNLVLSHFFVGMVLVFILSLVVIPPPQFLSTSPTAKVSPDRQGGTVPGLVATDGYCGMCDMLVCVRDGQCVTCGSVVHGI